MSLFFFSRSKVQCNFVHITPAVSRQNEYHQIFFSSRRYALIVVWLLPRKDRLEAELQRHVRLRDEVTGGKHTIDRALSAVL